MKNRIFIVAAILALLATACKKENPQNDLAETPITISASYGVSDGAKVNYTEDGNTITATWDEDDQLYVVYNNHVNTLTLSAGAGTASATFTGTVVGTPTAMSVLICYVRDANNPSAVEVSATGEYTYTSGVFLAQDGTLASAAKCNLFYGTTTYGNGSNISCTFTPNTSMMKLTVFAPDGVSADAEATLTYKSGTTELAKAIFTVGANGRNTIYLTVPAGEYTGVQTLVYQSGEVDQTNTLSETQACFAAGQTYSKPVSFGATTSLEALKLKINNGEDCTSYLGQYVTATGLVQPFDTDAIGIIAHIATSDVDSHLTGSRILVLSKDDVGTGRWGTSNTNNNLGNSGYENTQAMVALNNEDYAAFKKAWNYSVAAPENKQWFLPSQAQWINILASLGENNTQTLKDKTGMAATLFDGISVYWSSSQVDSRYGRGLTLYYQNSLVTVGNVWGYAWGKDNGWFIRAVFAY